jgi:hypothetical protein
MLSCNTPNFYSPCPNPVPISGSGQEASSLTHRHCRLLTQKRIFSPAYYFKVGTSGNSVESYIISAVLWLDYLQSSLFISINQTQMKLEPPSRVCQKGISISVYDLGKSWHHSAASQLCILFILFFRTFCNGPETGLKCKIGIRENIPLVFYHIQTVGA